MPPTCSCTIPNKIKAAVKDKGEDLLTLRCKISNIFQSRSSIPECMDCVSLILHC